MQTYRTEYPDFRIQIGQRVQLYAVTNGSGAPSYRIRPQADQAHTFPGAGIVERSGAYQVRYYGTAVVKGMLPGANAVMVALCAAEVPTNRAELAGLLEAGI